ncbi:MAG: site-specific integrase [Bacteroidaceae bacterium]|nr:site-specific integrase [Bacteroidaceae bacterium]
MGRVSIRYKNKSNGMKSVYLQFYPGINNIKGEIVKYEFLSLEMYSKPKTKAQREFNRNIMEVAESIKCQRFLQIIRHDYSFLAKDCLDGDFLEYFHKNADYHGPKFESARLHFELFCNNSCKFRDLSASLCEKYRYHLLHDKWLTDTDRTIAHNTASSYFNVFISMVKLAYRDNIISEDFTKDIKPIKWNHITHKEYLTPEEMFMLESIPYRKHPQLPTACLFSMHTGLRRSDILDLKWEHFVKRRNRIYIEKVIQKTGFFVSLPLSDDALRIIGKIKDKGPVFADLTVSILNIHIRKWLECSTITKHITFHSFRHTFAMMLTENGTPINIVAMLLGHRQLSSTQAYSKVTRKMAEEAITRSNDEFLKMKMKNR